MINFSIRGIRKIEFGEILFNKDTGESSRMLDIYSNDGHINILLCTGLDGRGIKIMDYELIKINKK